jgi:hypothetical protein
MNLNPGTSLHQPPTPRQPLGREDYREQEKTPGPLSKNSAEYVGLKIEAIGRVHTLLNMAMAMGNNDQEKDLFTRIFTNLENDTYENPVQAIEEAQNIVDQKQR